MVGHLSHSKREVAAAPLHPHSSEAQPTAWLAAAAVMAPLTDMTGGERLRVGELDGYAGYRRNVFGEFR